ncbi:hypothetical protein GQ55_3G307400 [Panicum hallii var. hallii]|uniref:Uncharacterized protein n=1 Tax=Panicum hallii var. hallii TaxID=1504633 RepID=A0A2T7EF29_9POAL|nr:hypothetical protein GQ55_3G307400 [Panicum hallii var. hallii]
MLVRRLALAIASWPWAGRLEVRRGTGKGRRRACRQWGERRAADDRPGQDQGTCAARAPTG